MSYSDVKPVIRVLRVAIIYEYDVEKEAERVKTVLVSKKIQKYESWMEWKNKLKTGVTVQKLGLRHKHENCVKHYTEFA